MKAFVIKNKEGKYLEEGKDRYGEDTIIWHKDIVYADIYSSKEIAEMRLEPFYRYCEVVEITIAEGDLEQDIKLDNAFWKQECDSLQSSLAEKDKQLAIRNKMIEIASENVIFYTNEKEHKKELKRQFIFWEKLAKESIYGSNNN